MIQEMKISLTELVTKFDKKGTKENAATSKRFTEGIAKLDNKYAHEIADQDTQIECFVRGGLHSRARSA